MPINSHTAGTATVLDLSGRFDAYEVPPVQEWLEKAAAAPPAHILVNMAEVNFIDSTALATLVQGMKRSREQGGDLRLCCLQQPVRIIFELTRLNKAIEIFADEAAAVASFDG
jgi:anti-sigma B factor antagonist